MSQQNNALVAEEQRRPPTLRERLVKMTPEFAKALPGHITPEKFVRTAQTAVQMNPDIGRAATATEGGMQSFFAACTKAATDGLILDGREAALVTFRQKVSGRNEPDRYEDRVQYLPMVAGLMKKARNSGEISSLKAEMVYEKDYFAFDPSTDEQPSHKPDWFGERGGPVGVYAVARMKDGTVMAEIMSRKQVMNIAGQSKNSFQYDPEKGKNYGEWWRKTAIRRLSKYLPSSSDRDDFLRAVERIDDDFDFDGGNADEARPSPQPSRKTRGGAAAALKDVTPAERPARTAEPEHDQETGEIVDADPANPDVQPGDDL